MITIDKISTRLEWWLDDDCLQLRNECMLNDQGHVGYPDSEQLPALCTSTLSGQYGIMNFVTIELSDTVFPELGKVTLFCLKEFVHSDVEILNADDPEAPSTFKPYFDIRGSPRFHDWNCFCKMNIMFGRTDRTTIRTEKYPDATTFEDVRQVVPNFLKYPMPTGKKKAAKKKMAKGEKLKKKLENISGT